jgi:hypothetical protein
MNAENNRYYAPSIEEFHIGFEFERFIPKSNTTEEKCWEKLAMSANYLTLDELDFEIIEKEIRVKYLDQQDIESLGFIEIETDKTRNKIVNTLTFKKEDTEILLYDREILAKHFPNALSLEVSHKYKFGKLVLPIEIKNLSELKKLLKQLNIC